MGIYPSLDDSLDDVRFITGDAHRVLYNGDIAEFSVCWMAFERETIAIFGAVMLWYATHSSLHCIICKNGSDGDIKGT